MAKLAANPFAQPDVRMREMERLLTEKTPAALRGVLRRFAANAQGHIADEEEKQWLEDALVEAGEAARAPLEDYIATEHKLTYALRALRRIAGDEAATASFLAVLVRLGPDDYRSGEAKLQLIGQLAELSDDARVGVGLVPFLSDYSDDVCWAVLDILDKLVAKDRVDASLQSTIMAHLCPMVTRENGASRRIAQRVAAFLHERAWPLPQGVGEVVAWLRHAYRLDGARRLQPVH